MFGTVELAQISDAVIPGRVVLTRIETRAITAKAIADETPTTNATLAVFRIEFMPSELTPE